MSRRHPVDVAREKYTAVMRNAAFRADAGSRRIGSIGALNEADRSVKIIASTANNVEGEALVSWELERFMRNPVILWGHDAAALPIGLADEIEQGPDGLSMRVVFASAAGNPLAEHVWQLVREGVVRAVSVGFDPGAQRKLADGSVERTGNVLLEVSFVTVPKDEDAGTADINPDARNGAAPRRRLFSEDSEKDDERKNRRTDYRGAELRTSSVEHFDRAMLSKVQWTAFGAARIPARFCRVGVLQYPGRRELRPRSEVLKADSIATLKGVPVVDVTDHQDFVSPDDFRQKVLGHVEEAHIDGDFVAGTLLIHDGPTIEAIKRGERLDISAGYYAPTDRKEGTWEGEAYDHVQRDIVYNHVALCPPGGGRAGRDVGLRLDAERTDASAEHPVDRARRENLERMRRMHESR